MFVPVFLPILVLLVFLSAFSMPVLRLGLSTFLFAFAVPVFVPGSFALLSVFVIFVLVLGLSALLFASTILMVLCFFVLFLCLSYPFFNLHLLYL